MKRIFLAISFTCVSFLLFAQKPALTNSDKPQHETEEEPPVDGYYKQNNIKDAKVTPYPNVREADVMYSKRIWREIDLREKMNNIYASPKSRLIDVIMEGISSGDITPYDASVSTKADPNGDAFTKKLSIDKAKAAFADSVVVPEFNANGEQIGTKVKAGEFNPDSIIKFRIKEDWIFDKNRSVYEPRIIGIAPLRKIIAGGMDLGYQPAFWIYFPNARHVFATKGVVSRDNDNTGLSYDDVFVKRLFSSYIVKESNTQNQSIKDYADGIDRLYESERIKKRILDYEHDLWSY